MAVKGSLNSINEDEVSLNSEGANVVYLNWLRNIIVIILVSNNARCYPIQFLGPALNGILSIESNLSLVSPFNHLSGMNSSSFINPFPNVIDHIETATNVPYLIFIFPNLCS